MIRALIVVVIITCAARCSYARYLVAVPIGIVVGALWWAVTYPAGRPDLGGWILAVVGALLIILATLSLVAVSRRSRS